jgi:superfamily II DNA or RNA helicase
LIDITIDNYLKIDGIPDSWVGSLSDLVSIPNEEKQRAIKEHVWGAENMPDRLTSLEQEEGLTIVPRGARQEIIKRLSDALVDYQINDKRIEAPVSVSADLEIELRPKQKEALESIIANEQGLVMASPGFGKTTLGLYAMCEIKQKTIILIDKTELAKQWIDRAKEQFNIELGLIGDKEWEEKDITVATLQTLRSREEDLDKEDFWKRWGAVFYDESHHASSETYYRIINKFPAKYRIGLSATKGKTKAREKISELVFGHVIFEDKTNNLKPTIHKVHTEFNFDYQGTEKVGNKVKRNNYHKLISSLIEDTSRNNLIAEKISSEPGCAHLVISRRLQHLEDIKQAVISLGFDEDKCYMLTGKESSDQRLAVAKKADEGSIAIFSTVADEGLDIPRLDRIHLVFPSKNHETTRQQVGRGLRNHNDKKETIVLDYVDSNVGVMRNQWRNRMIKYYKPNDFPIEVLGVGIEPTKP